MKKISMITLLMALMGVAVANPVSRDVARRVAQNWMQAQGMKNVAALQDITQQTPFAEFYVFAAPEGGFVLVSGDDCVQPVLAYSTVNRFEAEGMPQHVRGFLEGYDKEIRWWKTHVQPVAQVYASRAEADGKAGVLPEEWQRLVDGAAPQPVLATAVAPLLTTTWDQSPYYNALCPTNGGEAARAVTGCVATATAQVMKYHNHPATGYGSHTYSSSRNVNGTQYTYNNLSANFGATTYQWSQMPNALTSASSTAQVNAVATLMYHIGVANEMAYSPEASGSNNVYGGSVRASSQHSLMKYFKYRADMAVVRRDDYSHDDYCQRLRAELDQSRPLLYEGSDESGGHSFVLDGYNNSGYFHVNWGWGGYFDDYYAIGGLEPAGGGTGANMGSYNLDNDVLIGLRPHTAWSATGNTTVTATVQAGSPSGAAVMVMGGGDNNYGTQSSTYAYGDTVMVVASAPNGYRFDSWNDGDRNNPRYLVANGGSYSFTASYAAIPTDTVSYCNSDAWLSAYSLGSDKHWGVMFPASLLDAGKELSAVMFYAYEAGTYNITVYTGSNRETTAATVSHVVGSDMTRQWQTVALPTAVAATQDVWITFYAPNVTYPAAFTNYSGVDASCLVGSSFDLYGGYWLSSFMVKGVFTEPVSCDITSFPYTEDFEDVDALGCWRIYDGDGDGHTWTYASNSTTPLGYNSNSSLASASYDNNAGPLTPDNWLIAPSFVLPAGSQMHLKWQAKGLDANYASEYYSVYVSTTGNAIGDFTSLTPVYSGTTTNAWVQQDVDLSAYAGQTVYVAFRHHNCTDMYYLLIDDVEVSAGVAPQPTQYTLTVVSNNTAWGTVSGGGTYNAGATATLTATAAAGYHFVQWQDGNTQNPRTVTVTGNATYTATFASDASCAVTSFPWTEGFEGGIGACWSTIDNNNDGYGWEALGGFGNNGSSYSAASYSYVNGVGALTPDNWLVSPAIVVPATGSYDLSWAVSASNNDYPEEHYAVYVATAKTVAAFTATTAVYEETLTAAQWATRTVSLAAYAGQTVYVAFRHYNCTDQFFMAIDDVTITAGAAPQPTQYTLTVASNNTAWGTVSGGGTYNEGATVTLTATAATGYRFVSWQDGNTQNPRTVTVTGNATYTATFEAIPPTQYTITATSNNTAWGTVSGGGTYNEGATATLTATAATGYRFVQWQDGNTQNPRTVTVTGNATYTATFEAIPPTQYTLTVVSNNTAWGTVSGGGTYNEGATATLTATAATGYHFVQWQDGNTQNPRTVTVTANATYVATFADNVGIDDVEAAVISVAPNPATVFAEVGGLKAGSSVSLVDINGKVCYRGTAENGKLTLDVSGLAAGVYFVRVSDGTETAVRKLVVK
ncbi:MAG: choice-of-anchor J domain-containing protein [Bacteroidales bacterium]|nr:choice-of-anchor J domain-containing protein [Bacteroidales bacterium]